MHWETVKEHSSQLPSSTSDPATDLPFSLPIHFEAASDNPVAKRRQRTGGLIPTAPHCEWLSTAHEFRPTNGEDVIAGEDLITANDHSCWGPNRN